MIDLAGAFTNLQRLKFECPVTKKCFGMRRWVKTFPNTLTTLEMHSVDFSFALPSQLEHLVLVSEDSFSDHWQKPLPRTLKSFTVRYLYCSADPLLPLLPPTLEKLVLGDKFWETSVEEASLLSDENSLSFPPSLTELRIACLSTIEHVRALPESLRSLTLAFGASYWAGGPSQNSMWSALPRNLEHLSFLGGDWEETMNLKGKIDFPPLLKTLNLPICHFEDSLSLSSIPSAHLETLEIYSAADSTSQWTSCFPHLKSFTIIECNNFEQPTPDDDSTYVSV
jgi:hypothetical protein